MKKRLLVFTLIAAWTAWAALSASDREMLASIVEPTVVGVPPAAAVRDMCRCADGEIRHYGWKMVNGKKRRVYVASRDEGLSWKTVLAAEGDHGAMTRSPWSGEWIGFAKGFPKLCLLRSKVGPGDVNAEVTELPFERAEVRQILPLRSRKRWVVSISDIRLKFGGCYNAAVILSDDDGRSWRWVQLPPADFVPKHAPGDKRPHWFNNGCEPSVAELADGTLVVAARTSGPHHIFYKSVDGGETWSAPVESDVFWAANTMPLLFRLKDGRLLFIWNNTAMLPTRDLSEYPELNDGERSGQWETVFTNRDALHCAISEDDGKTWIGFREIALNEIRNAADFRELGNSPAEEHDKSVHQTQALELEGGKVLLAFGQNSSARRFVIFDPKWLYETDRVDDFRHGLRGISNHLYVKSLSGGTRGWGGHCAWERVPGALLVREPETGRKTRREALQLCRVKDERLVSDRQGIVWNFPASRKGIVRLVCRIDGAGFRLTLADHWMNPCDEVGPGLSPVSCPVTSAETGVAKWVEVTARWDMDVGTAVVSCDGHIFAERKLTSCPRFGLSYLHLQTLAEEMDVKGTYFRSFEKRTKE
ncbi:MAG: sialidase family protein [Kiritimatiellia bacterium]